LVLIVLTVIVLLSFSKTEATASAVVAEDAAAADVVERHS